MTIFTHDCGPRDHRDGGILMDGADASARRMAQTIVDAARRSPRAILVRQFQAVTTWQERSAPIRLAPVLVSAWFEVALLEVRRHRADARKAVAKKRAIARRAKKAIALPHCDSEKLHYLKGVAITSASLLR